MANHILLVEDNEQNRYLITYLLTHAGMDVTWAGDGISALRLAGAHVFDLVLLDVQLPGMDGYEVACRLREQWTTPIIAVTSYAMAGDREKALASGCNGYIEKPINPDNFVNQVASMLQDSEANS